MPKKITDYETFYNFVKLLHEAGNKHDSKLYGCLMPMVLFGRYHIDQFGQIIRLNREVFTDDDRKNMPGIMLEDEFEKYIDEKLKSRAKAQSIAIVEGVSGLSPSFPLPPPHIVCAKCNTGWTLENCHDIDAQGGHEDLDLAPFIGMTLLQVKEIFASNTDAVRYFGGSINVSKDEGFYLFEEDTWQKTDLEHVVKKGDKTIIYCDRFYHGICYQQLLAEEKFEEEQQNLKNFKEMFESAGFEEIKISSAKLPAHLKNWMAADLAEEDMKKVENEIAYYKVNTKQATFGVFLADYLMLDLENSGVSISDVDPMQGAQMPPKLPQIMALTGEPEQLLRLWQAFANKK